MEKEYSIHHSAPWEECFLHPHDKTPCRCIDTCRLDSNIPMLYEVVERRSLTPALHGVILAGHGHPPRKKNSSFTNTRKVLVFPVRQHKGRFVFNVLYNIENAPMFSTLYIILLARMLYDQPISVVLDPDATSPG